MSILWGLKNTLDCSCVVIFLVKNTRVTMVYLFFFFSCQQRVVEKWFSATSGAPRIYFSWGGLQGSPHQERIWGRYCAITDKYVELALHLGVGITTPLSTTFLVSIFINFARNLWYEMWARGAGISWIENTKSHQVENPYFLIRW